MEILCSICMTFSGMYSWYQMRPDCTLCPVCVVCVSNMFTLSCRVFVILRKRNVFVSEQVSNISSYCVSWVQPCYVLPSEGTELTVSYPALWQYELCSVLLICKVNNSAFCMLNCTARREIESPSGMNIFTVVHFCWFIIIRFKD